MAKSTYEKWIKWYTGYCNYDATIQMLILRLVRNSWPVSHVKIRVLRLLLLLRRKSTIIKDCVDPVYNETFVWENVPHLKNLTLWCKVMDHDPIKNDKLGSCKIKIDELPFEGNKFVSCDRVVDRNLLKANGRIYLHIKWEQ